MNDLNNLNLIGRIVKDAELKTNANGLYMAKFTIAVNKDVKQENGDYGKYASFFPLTVFGSYAKNIYPHLLKGTLIAVDGSLKQLRWEKDGVKRSCISIVVRNIQLLKSPVTVEEQENVSEYASAIPDNVSTADFYDETEGKIIF